MADAFADVRADAVEVYRNPVQRLTDRLFDVAVAVAIGVPLTIWLVDAAARGW